MAASQPDNAPQPIPAAPGDVIAGAPAFSVDAQWVRNSNGLRFDATHYNPRLAGAIALLRGSGMELRPLGEVAARVFIPPRFKRIYVEESHGVPFIQGSHLVHFQPADLKYLSLKAHAATLKRWIIEKDWVLVTCSGTIGRVAIAPAQWDGWAASQHIMRVVAKDGDVAPPGYLCAFLRSFAGQTQLTSQIYGAVVDELTEDQARGILVPIAKTAAQRAAVKNINSMTLKAVQVKAAAVELADSAQSEITGLLGGSEE
jgi:type I restriction enzyme S subunit